MEIKERVKAVTEQFEQRAENIPPVGYVGLALGSMAVSALLAFAFRKRDLANFVGLWAPSILIIGIYNRIRKLEHEEHLIEKLGPPVQSGIPKGLGKA